MVDSLNEIEFTKKESPLLPSVLRKAPVSPSEFGRLKSLIITLPDPLASNSRLSFDLLVDIVLPEKVILSGITNVVKFKGLKSPAAGSFAPMTVLSIVPSSRFKLLICTDPVPLPSRSRSALDVVTFNTLSVKLSDESIVKLLTFTTPVPPGESLRSAFELVEIILSLNVRLSTVIESANDVAPDTEIEPIVVVPDTSKVPVVLRFSSPKLIAPLESVIDPSVSVKFPIVELSPAFSVPVVVKFSSPKLIAPEESTMDPSPNVKFPNAMSVAKVWAPLNANPSDVV